MALFKKKISPEEQAFKEENAKKLETFNVTKAWGIKKYGPAMQFIYDKDARNFVVVEGPEETFRERNPYIISFDQVEDVTLEIEETWSEDKNEYAPAGYGILLQDKYDEVYWRYNFYLIIKTSHPYAKEIKYKMNFKPTITKVRCRNFIFVRRGYELGGQYKGKEITALVEKMENMLVEEAQLTHKHKVVDIITLNRPDTVLERLVKDGIDDLNLKKLDNMTTHVKRAQRIAKLLGMEME